MILENKWYEADTVQDSGFFTDLQSRSREKIVWFPKIYYQMEKGLLHIRCEITLGKYQDQLLRLEDKLESGLYCEMTDKTLHDGYIEYTLLYDMIANRITIDEVRAENGCLRLMKNLVWEYDALPHALIAGGTGGGKTYFLLTLIEALLHTNAVLYILDPKNADLGDIFIYTSADEEKGVLLELKGRGCRQFESYLLAQQRSWYDFLMDALVDGGVMKRIDLAINDHTGILDIPELAEK